MQVSVGAGTYVVAVSGGVDSMVLLDLLMQQYGSKVENGKSKVRRSDIQTFDVRTFDSNRKFIVAHFDHGIREDSAQDRQLVQDVAKKHKLPFVHKNGHLGQGTSAAGSRKARYEFLHQVMHASGARGIITAHHQDDKLETAILNLMRGTGRRGLTSLKSTDVIVRPLLGYTKDQLREYATNHQVVWREDSSNLTNRYTRNYIRHEVLPHFLPGHRAQLLILLENLQTVNDEIDVHIINLLHAQTALNKIDRRWFVHLPHDIASEVVHAWLRRHKVRNLERKTIERLIVAMKTGKTGQRIDVDLQSVLVIQGDYLTLLHRKSLVKV